MSYLALLIGTRELALRGIAGRENREQLISRISVRDAAAGITDSDTAEIRKMLEKIGGPLELRSEYQGKPIIVEIDEIAREMADNHTYLLQSTMDAAGALLILAHEVSKDAPWHDTGSLWEFLRHCRNAAAHGGTFNLRSGEPRRPAVWGKFAIETHLQGTRLFKDNGHAGLLSPGDPIRLLWDIEQAYPQMQAKS